MKIASVPSNLRSTLKGYVLSRFVETMESGSLKMALQYSDTYARIKAKDKRNIIPKDWQSIKDALNF